MKEIKHTHGPGTMVTSKRLENTGSAGHLAPAGWEDVVVTEEVTHWAGEDRKKEKEVGRKGVNQD